MAKTQKKSKKSSIALLLLLIAFVIIIGSALAFFSDLGAATFAGTAGTVEIEVDENMTAVQYYTAEGVIKKDADFTILNPGDYILLTFDVKNIGEKSVWVKAALGDIEVNGIKDDSGDVFELLAIKSTDLATIGAGKTYATFDAFMMAKAGTYANFETPTNADAIALNGTVEDNDADDDEATLVYVLYFNADAGNKYQEATVDVTIDVQAVQYRNNGTASTADFTTVASRLVVGP